ncbi:MAG: UDP-N-acetylglucosamine 2-epimerase [Candidatus Rokubacteria bacterium]|nr:UDP-N-acetylglucosamine 2-epimerase [Candidatus Rokubacteria bacterium]
MTAPRVLILTASYGSGHDRVALTLADAFRGAGAVPRVVDHFRELVHPRFAAATESLYGAVLRNAPALWGLAYWVGDQISASSPLLLGMNRIGTRKLARLLAAERPDHVVTVHPTPAAVLGELAAGGIRVPPHTIVFTDFVTHAQWVQPHVDHYCVPAEEIARELIARGVSRERVVVTGIPVRREFGEPADRAAARLALGLSPRHPVFLFMAGSAGTLGRLEDAARAVLLLDRAVQAVFLAGRDDRLAARLRQIVAGHESRLKVVGYVDDVRLYMAAADFVTTKAGGITLAEALAAEAPIICFGSLPGQEVRNERFATVAGVGLLARSPAQLPRVLGIALRDTVLVRDIRERVRRYRRPDAAAAVVSVVLPRLRAVAERAS